MKPSISLCSGVMAAALCALAAPASADTASAHCEVRKHGETEQGRSGPCDFSQRQGYVVIDLRDGEKWELSPAEEPQKFRDQKGNAVVRTASGDSHEYKWEHKKIIVTFGGGGAAHGASASGNRNSFDTVCGVIVQGQDSAYRCQVTDHYSGGQKTHTTLRFPDQTIELTWRPGSRVGLQFEGMAPKEARYAGSEGEINWLFEGKTYYYFSDEERARHEVQNLKH
jgi:hypothetical protein